MSLIQKAKEMRDFLINANSSALLKVPTQLRMEDAAKQFDVVNLTTVLVDRDPSLKNWLNYLRTKDLTTMTAKDINRVCWNPEIAISPEFISFLNEHKIALRKSGVRAICYSLAMIAKLESPAINNILNIVSNHLVDEKAKYIASNARSFFENPDSWATKYSASEFLKSETVPVEKLCQDLGFSIKGSFAEADFTFFWLNRQLPNFIHISDKSFTKAFDGIVQSLQRNKDCLIRGLQILLSSSVKSSAFRLAYIVGYITDQTRSDLGDPRNPLHLGKWPRDCLLKKIVISYLSQQNIKFFFDQLIPEKEDRQGRRDFWLNYADRILGARIVLDDEGQRLIKKLAHSSTELSKIVESSNFGNYGRFSNATASAFIMQFERCVVVEFSKAPNACYVYDDTKQIENIQLWRNSSFQFSELRQQKKNAARLSHHKGWQRVFREKLAEFGVR